MQGSFIVIVCVGYMVCKLDKVIVLIAYRNVDIIFLVASNDELNSVSDVKRQSIYIVMHSFCIVKADLGFYLEMSGKCPEI